MPRMDRTGPAGSGPMTGGSFGACGDGSGRGFGRRSGLGRGRGQSVGPGRGLGWFSVGYNGVGYNSVGYNGVVKNDSASDQTGSNDHASEIRAALEARAAFLRVELSRTEALLRTATADCGAVANEDDRK